MNSVFYIVHCVRTHQHDEMRGSVIPALEPPVVVAGEVINDGSNMLIPENLYPVNRVLKGKLQGNRVVLQFLQRKRGGNRIGSAGGALR